MRNTLAMGESEMKPELATQIIKRLTRDWHFITAFPDKRAISMSNGLLAEVLTLIENEKWSDAELLVMDREDEILLTPDWVAEVNEQTIKKREGR